MFRLEAELELPVTAWLAAAGFTVRREVVTPWGKIDLVGVAPAESLAAGDLIAIELKLSRAADVLLQARNNRALTWASYAALPAHVAWRVAGTELGAEFLDAGVGLLAIEHAALPARTVEVVCGHRPREVNPRERRLWQQMHDLRARLLAAATR